MDLKTTKKVGNYTLGPNILGSGSFSVVYSALDIKGTSIAAKVIPLTNFNGTFYDIQMMLEYLSKDKLTVSKDANIKMLCN